MKMMLSPTYTPVSRLTPQPICYGFVADSLIQSRHRQLFATNTSHPVDPTDTPPLTVVEGAPLSTFTTSGCISVFGE